jgi:hypothetical protein
MKAGLLLSFFRPMGVPRSRNGKHKKIVAEILSALDRLENDLALQITSAELGDNIDGVRSALYRAAQKSGRKVATRTDAKFLYVWSKSE